MTNYPQQQNFDGVEDPQSSDSRGPESPSDGARQGISDDLLNDPGVRMVLSIAPQDGSLTPLPENLNVEPQANGSIRIEFPDGSVRELLPGAENEGRMITTLADGTRIQSDLTFGDGQVSLASISSTGEKTLLSLNENGANIQRVTNDGQVFNFIPDSAPELIQGFREAEAFVRQEDFNQQDDFEAPQGDYFPKPDYAANNWVDNGNGSWIAPVQPDAFMAPPAAFMPPQQFGEWNNYGKPSDWQPEQNWQPPQGDYFPQPMAYQPPQGDYFPQPMGYAPPQQFATGFMQPGAAFGLDPQPEPPHTMMGGNWQPPQFGNAQGFADPSGFPPPPFKDASGFPISTESSIAPGIQAMFDQGAPVAEISSGDGAEFDNVADQDQIPNQ